jgi:hypothetical protein
MRQIATTVGRSISAVPVSIDTASLVSEHFYVKHCDS